MMQAPNELRNAFAKARRAREAYLADCLVVWRHLQAAEPALAADILSLWFDEGSAARWVCEAHVDDETPVAWVLAGRIAELRLKIHRTMHGFVG